MSKTDNESGNVNGPRVGAILCIDEEAGELMLIGYGVYVGDFVPEGAVGNVADLTKLLGKKNPKIVLDNGKVVWGCECWWGPEKEIKKSVEAARNKGMKITEVDMEKVRQEFIEEECTDEN